MKEKIKQQLANGMIKSLETIIEHPFATVATLGVASFAVGAYHGYCTSKNISVGNETEFALKYAPMFVSGALGALFGGLSGQIVRAISGWRGQDVPYAAICGASIGGAIGGGLGALGTTTGYGAGYLAGRMM